MATARTTPAVAPELIAELVADARQAGFSDADLRALRRVLQSPDCSAEEVEIIRRQIAARAAQQPRPYVVTIDHLLANGEMIDRGTTLMLTPEQAREYGAAVGEPPPSKVPPAERKAGKYRVWAGGSVKHDGRFHGPGTVLDLSQVAAQSLGDEIEPV